MDIPQESYEHAQSICMTFGSDLATVLDQTDFDTLNFTLKAINVQEHCGRKMFLGARSPDNSVWSWRTGVSISLDWSFWGPNDPNWSSEACMRMMIMKSYWMEMRDESCTVEVPDNFKCCICDSQP